MSVLHCNLVSFFIVMLTQPKIEASFIYYSARYPTPTGSVVLPPPILGNSQYPQNVDWIWLNVDA